MSGEGTRSNRLLGLFQAELQKAIPGSGGGGGRAPSHGGSCNLDPVDPPTRRNNTTRLRKARARAPVTAAAAAAAVAGAGHEAGVLGFGLVAAERDGTLSTGINLERENAQLREQLKFQGAVLDQLAGDVHTLERKVAGGTGKAQVRRPSSQGQQARADSSNKQESRRKGVANDKPPDPRPEGTAVGDAGRFGVDGQSLGSRSGCEDAPQKCEGLLRDEASEEGNEGEDYVDDRRKKHSCSCCSHDSRKCPTGGEPAGGSSERPSSPGVTSDEPSGTGQCDEGPGLSPVAVAPDSLACPTRETGQAASEVQSQPNYDAAFVGEEESHENSQLKAELREAVKVAEKYRRELAAAREKAEEKEQSHVDLLARERKFRAAVEAGLREKVHNMRRRARHREERLSVELASVKTQLRETVNLLTTTAEEACSMRTRLAEQEETAAATLAKYRERDRHANWLERRLEEVSSGEAASASMRLEEMASALESKERELESLRASVRVAKSKRLRGRQWQQTVPREVEKSREDGQAQASPLNPHLLSGCCSEKNHGEDDQEAPSNLTAAGDAEKVKLASAAVETVVEADQHSSPVKEETPGVRGVHDVYAGTVNQPGCSTKPHAGTTKTCVAEAMEGGDPAEYVKDGPTDRPEEHNPAHEGSNSSHDAEGGPTRPGLQKTRVQSRCGIGGGVISPTGLSYLGEAPSESRGGVTSPRDGEKKLGEHNKSDEHNSNGGGVLRTRTALQAEADFLARVALCESDSRTWGEEAMCVRVTPKEMLRRRELTEVVGSKDQTISERREATSSLDLDLRKRRGAHDSLHRQLKQDVQAGRSFPKRPRSTRAVTLSEANAQPAKAPLTSRRTLGSFGGLGRGIVDAKRRTASDSAEDRSGSSPGGASRRPGANPETTKPDRVAGLQAQHPVRASVAGEIDLGDGRDDTGDGVKGDWSDDGKGAEGDRVEAPSTEPEGGSPSEDTTTLEHQHQERRRREKLILEEGPGGSGGPRERRPGPGGRELAAEQSRRPRRPGRPRDPQRQDVKKKQQSHGGGETQGQGGEDKEGEEDEGEAELELMRQGMERERQRFEAEREVLERERQESSRATEAAENKAEELKAAWQALAEKVVSLADRNADLEWALLKLRREGSSTAPTRCSSSDDGDTPMVPARTAFTTRRPRQQEEVGGTVSSDGNNNIGSDEKVDGNHCNDHRRPSSASSGGGNSSSTSTGTSTSVGILYGDREGKVGGTEVRTPSRQGEDPNNEVPRTSLDCRSLFEQHEAL